MSEQVTTDESGGAVAKHKSSLLVEDDYEKSSKHQRLPPVITKSIEKMKKVSGKVKQGISSEKEKLNVTKKSYSISNEKSPESIPMSPKETLQKRPTTIPAQLSQITTSNIEISCQEDTEEKSLEKQADREESSTDEISELRDKVNPGWDDEEAGGLPRSESRASRVSRAVRQLFCCGVPYEAPDEDQISYDRGYAI